MSNFDFNNISGSNTSKLEQSFLPPSSTPQPKIVGKRVTLSPIDPAQGQKDVKGLGEHKITKDNLPAAVLKAIKNIWNAIKSLNLFQKASSKETPGSIKTSTPNKSPNNDKQNLTQIKETLKKDSFDPQDISQIKQYLGKKGSDFSPLKELLAENPTKLLTILKLTDSASMDAVLGKLTSGVETKTLFPLTKLVLSNEIAECKEEGNLLRQNSIASKLVSIIQRKELGEAKFPEKLESILKENLGETKFLSPDKTVVDEKNLVDSSTAILQKVTDELTTSLPDSIKDIYKHVQTEIDAKFPGKGEKHVVSLLFLRYVNTSIVLMTTPTEGKELTPIQKDNIMIVAKLLMNLVNSLEQPIVSKEPQYVNVNEAFISVDNLSLLRKFAKKLIQ